MLSITPTKLNDYLTCPLKFKYRYIEKSGGIASTAAFSFGNSVHRVLQQFHNQKSDDPTSLLEVSTNAEKLLKRFWEKNAYENDEEESSYFIKGCRALENYCEAAGKERTETLGTEVYMSFVIDFKGLKIRLGCKADRLALHQDQMLEIIDYKTNRSGQLPTAESLENHLPTFIYFVLARLTYPQYPNIKFTFLNVLSMSKVSVCYEKSLVDENKRALWECLKTLAAENYAPRVSEACSWCDFQDDCPATSRIVDFRQV